VCRVYRPPSLLRTEQNVGALAHLLHFAPHHLSVLQPNAGIDHQLALRVLLSHHGGEPCPAPPPLSARPARSRPSRVHLAESLPALYRPLDLPPATGQDHDGLGTQGLRRHGRNHTPPRRQQPGRLCGRRACLVTLLLPPLTGAVGCCVGPVGGVYSAVDLLRLSRRLHTYRPGPQGIGRLALLLGRPSASHQARSRGGAVRSATPRQPVPAPDPCLTRRLTISSCLGMVHFCIYPALLLFVRRQPMIPCAFSWRYRPSSWQRW
jgi:hypothetical protein